MFPVRIICRTEDGAILTFEILEETVEWALTPAQGNLEGGERLMSCFDEGVCRVLLQNWGDKGYMMFYCGADLCLWEREPAWNYLEPFLVVPPDKQRDFGRQFLDLRYETKGTARETSPIGTCI